MDYGETRRLAPALGIEVLGFEPRGDAAAPQLVALLDQHLVVVLRDQDLSPDALVDLASTLGEPAVHPLVPHLAGHEAVQVIKNSGKSATLTEHWHTDVSFAQRPPKYTLLHARSVPAIGGDTQFANQYLAYESLSAGMRSTIDALSAEHRGDWLAVMMGKDPSEAPRAVHPVVRTHPNTAKRALYVCAEFTRWIDGWSPQESAGLLRFLFERSTQPEFTYRHHWMPGDVVIWDNRSTLHYAIHDHGDKERILHRVTVTGEIPV
ncbi:MAG: TauD/TfdA family dioxygenase [Acidimicrobiia bacterium]|nr:TauD/TfdA family dioxygenase [Acidimicrobiia bacterium]